MVGASGNIDKSTRASTVAVGPRTAVAASGNSVPGLTAYEEAADAKKKLYEKVTCPRYSSTNNDQE